MFKFFKKWLTYKYFYVIIIKISYKNTMIERVSILFVSQRAFVGEKKADRNNKMNKQIITYYY